MRFTLCAAVAAALLLAPVALHAQQRAGGGPPTLVSGVVRDAESEQPLAAASVAAWSASDSTLVTGTLTDEGGRFALPGLQPGSYYLTATYIGYGTRTVDSVTVSPASPRRDLGVIALAPQALELEGLVVEGERSAVQIQVDRTVYQADKLPAAAGGTATDVLRNLPSVEVDIDGNVSLRGNQQVAVQVNGRPMPLRGEQLAAFLEQLPASMVEKVEVIPNPSAKHDPSGLGGILNIVLKQNVDLGWSAGITLGAGTEGRYNASGNVGYQRGPLTVMTSYGWNDMTRDSDGSTFRTNLYLDPITHFDQRNVGERGFSGHVLNTNAEYKLTEKNSVNANVVFSMRDGERDDVNTYRVLDADRDVMDVYDRLTLGAMDNNRFDAALGFRSVTEPQRHEWSTELRWSGDVDDDVSRFEIEPGPGSATPAELEWNDQHSAEDELTAKLDWARPFGDAMKVEAGYKGALRMLDSDFHEEFYAAGATDPTTVRDNVFGFDEQVHAVYGLVTQDLGDFDLQGGLRVERTETTFDLTSTGESFDNDYLSWFPSASVLYELEPYGARTVRASYSRRIERPRTRFLNPFPMSEDQLNRFVGNPGLGPEYTDSWELAFQESGQLGTLQLTPFYRRTTDVIRRYKEIDEATGVSTTTFRNLDTSESYGTDLTGSFRFGPVNGFVGLSAYQQETSGRNVQAGLSSESFTWSARLSASYKVTPSTDVQYFQFYRGPQDVEQGRVSGFTFTNLAVRQKLAENMSLTLRVMDPFDKMGFEFRTADEDHLQITERDFDARAAYLSFNWTFGEQPRMRQRGQEGGAGDMEGAGDIGIN